MEVFPRMPARPVLGPRAAVTTGTFHNARQSSNSPDIPLTEDPRSDTIPIRGMNHSDQDPFGEKTPWSKGKVRFTFHQTGMLP